MQTNDNVTPAGPLEQVIGLLTDSRPKAFFDLLEERAKELAYDYPFTQNDAFEYLWALTSSLEGTTLACEDWYKRWMQLMSAMDRLMKSAELCLGGWTDVHSRDALRFVMDSVQQELATDFADWKLHPFNTGRKE
jgi:hypothetical protein